MDLDLDDYTLGQIVNALNVVARSKNRLVCRRWKQLIGEIFWMSSVGKRLHLEELSHMIPHDAVLESSYMGSIELVRVVVSKMPISNMNWFFGLCGACQGGHREIAQWMIDKGANNWNLGLSYACQGGHREIVQWIIDKGANEWNSGLRSACYGGHQEIVQWMIEKGANDWDSGLYTSCYGGHRQIVQWMIDKGANNWNLGLLYACQGGHRDIAKWMIDKGANDWNWGLRGACREGRQEIAQWMIEMGATNCGCGETLKEHMMGECSSHFPPYTKNVRV
jgi:hypothetical protein